MPRNFGNKTGMMTLEWRNRLNCWRKVLPDLYFVSLGEVRFEGFTTLKHLTPEVARTGAFRPFPPETPWGASNEYAWFRSSLTVPESARGEQIVLRPKLGLEALIWINGTAVGSRGWADRETILTYNAEGGGVFEVLIEAFAGNGARESGGGPCPDGHAVVPETPAQQVKVERSEFGIWNEEVFQLWMDVETLAGLVENLADKESLRLARIEEALQEMTLVVDLELPRAEMLESVRRGREVLKPVLEAHNGSSAPALHCFGHAHLDLAWLWPLAETDRKCGRTFSNQLTLMQEYPEYKFLQSQAYLYEVAQRLYPELYEKVREAVQRGQWIVDGAMYVEADTNVPSGESLIRQFLYGKRFFKEAFGVESRMMWLPDVFGYSAALPQIMKGCRVDYFSTQKIFWAFDGGETFPYNWFWWKGIDGSSVLCYFHNNYNSQTDPKSTLTRWNERVQKEAFHSKRLVPFGWGDGGGGPTRIHMEYLRRQRDLEGAPRCAIAAPEAFFDEMAADSAALAKVPTWVGELYLQMHRGTYTTQAKTKQGNRRAELALHELEFWGSAAALLRQEPFPAAEAQSLWKDVLLNQFHDIIPGSSICQVYKEAEALYGHVIEEANRLTSEALSGISGDDPDALTLFNSLSWDRQEIVELPEGFDVPADAGGQPLLTQQLNGKTLALTPRVPATGWTTLRRGPGKAGSGAAANRLAATPNSIENEVLRITLNERGELTSIWDKQHETELAAGCCNAMRLYKDVPNMFDAWDVVSNYKLQPVALDSSAEIEVIAEGPLVAVVRVKRRIHNSELRQDIVLRTGSRRVEFHTEIDWRENHKLLKVNFPVNVQTAEALHEIQFGYISRANHASHPKDAAQFEVCQQRWTALAEADRGAAVLNDCKYGVDVDGNSINLTLLRSPLAPDPAADRGLNQFTYAFYAWEGRGFLESGVQKEAAELNAPLLTAPGAIAPGSLFDISAPNVVLETAKLAEDGSGDLIVRLYESGRTTTRVDLAVRLPVSRATLTNMLEENERELPFDGKTLPLEFRPFEVKTIRFSRG